MGQLQYFGPKSSREIWKKNLFKYYFLVYIHEDTTPRYLYTNAFSKHKIIIIIIIIININVWENLVPYVTHTN